MLTLPQIAGLPRFTNLTREAKENRFSEFVGETNKKKKNYVSSCKCRFSLNTKILNEEKAKDNSSPVFEDVLKTGWFSWGSCFEGLLSCLLGFGFFHVIFYIIIGIKSRRSFNDCPDKYGHVD